MHSSDHSRRTQRRRPELNINTSPAGSRSRDAVPSTPPKRTPVPAKGKPPVSSRRIPAAASSATRDSGESFLDNGSPVDMGKTEPDIPRGRPMRDSHDLSLPTRQYTRDSLVTNMLSSLDQFSLGQIHTPLGNDFDEEEDDSFGVPRGDGFSRSMTGSTRPALMYSAGNSHSHGHSHSHSHSHSHGYSYSSDFDGTDDGASKISSQFSRGRRSNSSSGFQSSLGRINSMREGSHPSAPAKSPLHSRGGKTSKSSSMNSIDVGGYAQVLASQRLTHGMGGRSTSFDHGQRLPLNPLNTNADSPSAWKTEFSNTFLVDDYEAAPTPTIPGGPRRLTIPSSPAVRPPAPPAPEPKTPDRKKNTRSRSGTNKTTQSNKYNTASRPMPEPALPTLDLDSAPAPHVGYEKSKDAQQDGPNSAPPTKERQGFFSRLFGSSRNAPVVVESTSAPVTSTPADTVERTGSRTQHIASQMKAESAPPSRDSQPAPPPDRVIQKKSSFFRRRKKSIAEPPMPPPPIPAAMDLTGTRDESIPAAMDLTRTRDQSIPKPEPSPVSSLRQVMNPYLAGSTPSTPSGLLKARADGPSRSYDLESRDEENNRRTRGFSPDYEPSPSATIRTVKSTPALKNSRGHTESPMRSPPDVPAKPVSGQDTATFFHDSSDEGEGTRRHRSSRPFPLADDSKSEAETARSPGLMKPEPSPSLALKKNNTFDSGQIQPSLGLPIEGSRSSLRKSPSRPAPSPSASSLPSLKVDSAEVSPGLVGGPMDEPEFAVGEPTEDDRQKAQRIYDGNEDFIQKEKAAAWMGEEGLVRQRTLKAYMDLYDFENQTVLTALRQICSRLVFRAETQQVDRILVAFSQRWCDCNPNHGFKTKDVIHTMCYSIMLLNTDLHLANIEQKMTRSQFVKNTMTTVKHAVADSAPEAYDRTSILPGKNTLLSPTDSEAGMSTGAEQEPPRWRHSFRPPPRSESQLGFRSDSGTPVDTCGPLVNSPFDGTLRAWEGQMETVLKDIYTSIRDERLPLFGADPTQTQAPQQTGLSVMGMLKRSPSVLSKAPSESHASMRGRINDGRNNGGRWNSKSRSRPRFAGNGFSSSRTSFDDGNSIWSPTVSSATWSRYSLGRTHTSMSNESFGSGFPHGDYHQSIGFANALSQAIIREDGPPGNSAQSVMSDEIPTTQLLEDESLELLGSPWAKEGIVIHKHHLDGIDKKAKERNWSEVFAVVQKGTMSLFSFSTKSMRHKARSGRKHAAGAVVGGGNWQENATSVGTFSLRQTMASALPPPGYSRSRTHVWALSLPTGAVHLFQVGTPEISKEFVLTVNYWSARLSTHPLMGGISNIEYGWSDDIVNNALVSAINETTQPARPGSAAAPGRSSMHSRQGSRQSSIRSSFDVGTSSNRIKLPGDRVHITEWTPPAQSMRASNCSEAEQLETLLAYVKSIEDELQQHNQLRSPMLLAFTPRGQNSGKAMSNWERKSSYLLREIVKFRTYVDSLQEAGARRAEILTERENARRAARGEDVGDEDVTLKVA
ncbi:Uu.00g145440.m01.CDS01 [Anthostomella pinea]|uniref:Uu.00g145440.m01.CDS01 n=1 Tax=Anthostomella pinea TaxID=933095 RepID=A0AAI8VR30_9PEZI|nr:Uu.00g145440.m01.CDS01 [Anthostomella pinea]